MWIDSGGINYTEMRVVPYETLKVYKVKLGMFITKLYQSTYYSEIRHMRDLLVYLQTIRQTISMH
jgi:hypothetical protein